MFRWLLACSISLVGLTSTGCGEPLLAQAIPNPYSQAFIRTQIALLEDGLLPSEGVRLTKVRHLDEVAYLLKAPCCDLLDLLFDVQGRFICAPSGGMTGQGDGHCPLPAPPGHASSGPVQ